MVDPFAKTPHALDLRLLPKGMRPAPVRIRVSAAPWSPEAPLPAAPGAVPAAPGVPSGRAAWNRAVVTLSSEEIAALQSAIRNHEPQGRDVAGAPRITWLEGVASFVASRCLLLIGTLGEKVSR